MFRLIGIQADDQIGEAFHKILVMQHTDDRARLSARLFSKDFKDTACEVRVQIGHWFVCEEHLRLLKQRTRERGTLLLAPRDLKRAAVDLRGKTETVENLRCLFAGSY